MIRVLIVLLLAVSSWQTIHAQHLDDMSDETDEDQLRGTINESDTASPVQTVNAWP